MMRIVVFESEWWCLNDACVCDNNNDDENGE